MSRRTTGMGFIFVAAMLYAVRFIAAAIYGSGMPGSWSNELFRGLLQYVDQGLTTFSIIALAAGVLYLVWAELASRKTT